MGDFRKLHVWERAEDLAVRVHEVAGKMRGASTSDLRDQLRRAAQSVPSNIVEGSAHESPREFIRFLRYSIASVTELEGHLRLAGRLKSIRDSEVTALVASIEEIRKMLHGLVKKLRQSD